KRIHRVFRSALRDPIDALVSEERPLRFPALQRAGLFLWASSKTHEAVPGESRWARNAGLRHRTGANRKCKKSAEVSPARVHRPEATERMIVPSCRALRFRRRELWNGPVVFSVNPSLLEICH